jgi:DNA-binding CsgD family transcriptional regulator
VNRLVGLAGDLGQVRAELDGLLRRRVGYDIAAISTTDPATGLWTSCYVSGLTEDSARDRESVLFDIEFQHGDVNPYADLAQSVVPVGRLHEATSGDLDRALRYGALLRDLGVVDEMRVVLRTGDAWWGTLALYRAGAAEPFSDAAAARVAASAPAMANLIRLALLRTAIDAEHGIDEPPGLLLVARDGTISDTSGAAESWLRTVDDRGRVPSAVRCVVAAARAHGMGRVSLPTRTGRWIVLHGAPLDAGPVSVIIEGARPAALSAVIADAYAFTPRERDVTALATQGRSTQQIATALGISAFTVQDHLKSIFAKARVQSRGELLATIFMTQYRPRWDAGATPAPTAGTSMNTSTAQPARRRHDVAPW